MKLNLFFLVFFFLQSQAQISYFIEYNISNDFLSADDVILNNNISFGIKKKKAFFSLGFGREDWYLEYFNNQYFTNPSQYNAHCRTYKFSALFERQFFIPKTKLFISFGAGGKLYFLNQMKDSLSHSIYGHALSTLKPSVLQNAKDTYDNPFQGNGLEYYSYITNVPFAFTANLALQYRFKKLGLKLYYEPYFMRIKYRNAKYTTKTGATYAFYSNIGLGINYPLNFKKKDQKVIGIE
jgi:hypothetical protein